MGSYRFIFFASALLVFIFDQSSKILVKTKFFSHEPKTILPFFNVTYVENRGIAFGLFHNGGNVKHLLLLVATLLAIVVLLYLFFSNKNSSPLKAFIYGIIVGGASGNLYDRLVRGYVIDFLDLYVGKYHWPVFNVADTFITIGIILVFYLHLFKKDDVF